MTKGNQSLTQNETFNKVNKYLPQRYSQYFYLDINQLREMLENNLSTYSMFIPQEALVLLQSIDGIGGVNSLIQDNPSLTELIIYMNPNN